MRRHAAMLAVCSAIAQGAGTFAQSPLDAANAVTQPRTDTPITALPLQGGDGGVGLLARYLTGSFASRGEDGRPALVMHAAPVRIGGWPDSILVEIARADSAATPFRMYVVRPYLRQGSLRLRTYELAGSADWKGALAGLWATPDVLPQLASDTVAASLDMPATMSRALTTAAAFRGATEHPFPVQREGAIEMTAAFEVSAESLRLADAGFDADGLQVWGLGNGKTINFARSDMRPLVRREEGGLVVITTVAPSADAPKLRVDGEVVIHYSTWTLDGQLVETSRAPGKQPVKMRVPGNVIPGVNTGLTGIAKGERRRLVIPPALGFGEKRRDAVPPNSTLVFDVECLNVDNAPVPDASPASPPRERPGASPHGAPGPSNEQPIGSPPTNAIPEKPR